MQVRVAPATGLAQLHGGVYVVADFDAAASGRAVPLADDSGWIPPVACALGGELAPQLTASTDRVVAQRIQKFESPVYGVGYRTRWGRGTVRVSGRPGTVVPDSDWSALRWRALGGAAAGVGVAALGVSAVGQYVAQHAWFELHGNAGWMRLLALGSGVVAAMLIGRLLLPASVRSKVWLGALAAPMLLGWLGMAVLWHTGGPSLETVAAALDSGDLERATAELEAVRAVSGEAAGYEEQAERLTAARQREEAQRRVEADKQHLAQVTEARTLEGRVAAAGGVWHDDAVAAQARAAVREVGERELTGAVTRHSAEDLRRLAQVLRSTEAELAARAEAEAKLAVARTSLDGRDYAGATEALDGWTPQDEEAASEGREAAVRVALVSGLEEAIGDAEVDVGEPEERVTVLAQTLERAKLYERLTEDTPPRSVQELERGLVKATREVAARKEAARVRGEKAAAAEQARIANAEAVEERRVLAAARKERRVEKARAAKARQRRAAWNSNHLLCCDNSRSPTCTYGRGSYQGCCSHHGGVCG